MLKKLLKGCLTVAMVGAFAAGVYAGTSFNWSGDAEGTFKQSTSKAAETDAKSISYMEMSGSGALDLSVKTTGDSWSGEAKLETDWDGDDLWVDDVYVVMYKDDLQLWFGIFDPVGIGYGGDYMGPADETIFTGIGENIPNEKPWFMAKFVDMGLSAYLGWNKGSHDITTDVTESHQEMYYGVDFEKTMGDLSLQVQYVGFSTSVTEDGSPQSVSGAYDGLSATELGLGVNYAMGDMAFSFNYVSASSKDGADAELLRSAYDLIFDMKLDENSGFSAGLSSKVDDNKTFKKTWTNITLGYKMSVGPVNHYVGYATSSNKTDLDNAETGTDSVLAYRMEVTFSKMFE